MDFETIIAAETSQNGPVAEKVDENVEKVAESAIGSEIPVRKI